MRTTFLAIFAAIVASSPAIKAEGLVNGFNVVSLGNFTGVNSDVVGTLAVAGDVTLQNYSLNQSAPVPNRVAGGYDTVVGGNLSLQNGSVYGTLHSASASLTNVSLCNGCSSVGGISPVDFGALSASTKAESTFLYQLSPTGSVADSYGTLVLNGTGNSHLQVFSITSAELGNSSGIDLANVGANATVVVNVSDSGAHSATTPTGGFQINGVQVQAADNVVFNFESTITDVSIANSFYSSMLAPYADVSGMYGVFSGDLVAGSYDGDNQFNLDGFTGRLPRPCSPAPEPASIGMMAGALLAGLGIRKVKKGR